MEHGFYSPSTGEYWQTTGNVAQRYRDQWPVDHVEIPVKPGADHDWDHSKKVWVENIPTPSSDPNDYPLERWQFQAMVDMLGKRSAIQQAINSLGTDMERNVANAKFNQANRFLRSDPLVTALATAVGMTSEELDASWMQAKDLV